MRLRSLPEGITVHKRPRLANPILIAAWPGVANIASTAIEYLRTSLGATEMADIDPIPFFDLEGAFVKDNLIQSASFPECKFYYWKDKRRLQDLIIFEADAQPKFNGYELATMVLDFAQRHNVGRVYTLAAALVEQFSEQPRVWAAAGDSRVLAGLRNQGMVLKGDFYVAGMNGLLLSVAKERNMEAVCLLGETPEFPGEIGNPFACLAMLEALAKVLDLGINFTELRQAARDTHKEIEKMLSDSRRDFLDQFTVSLWDSSEDEE